MSGGCARGVALSLPITHHPNHGSPYSLNPPSSPRSCLVTSSRWKAAGRSRPNGFNGTCRSRRGKGRHRHGSRDSRRRRTRSLDRLRPCPFDPGSSSGGHDGHFAGSCTSPTLGQVGDAHERSESDVHQSILPQRQAA